MENGVIEEAKKALKNGVPQLVHYKLKEVDLGHMGVCGGENDIFIDVIAGKKAIAHCGGRPSWEAVVKIGRFFGDGCHCV